MKQLGHSITERQNKLIKKYGKIFGFYTGANPNILVADPELANRVLNKDFHNFRNRSSYYKYFTPFPNAKRDIFQVRDEDWKQIRSLLSPAFSAFKLKEMIPIIEESIDSLLEDLSEKCETNEEFNICDFYHRFSVEIILKTAFGVKISAQNENDRLLRNTNSCMETKFNEFVLMLFMCFPELANSIIFLRGKFYLINQWFGRNRFGFLWKYCTQIIKIRKQYPDQRRNDILQAMLDSEIIYDRFSRYNKSDDKIQENLKQNNTKTHFRRNTIILTEDEIKTNSISFLLAGSDTTSVVLAYITHILVIYPEIQEKIRKEIIELYESEGKLNYNIVTKLQYMECVINETLRFYTPILNTTARECLADYKYENMTIPKGATIAICTHFLHKDSVYWTEPDVFDPMRFSPERRHEINSGSWQPFSSGPRNCIASRFAYLVLKFTIAKLLSKYRLNIGPNTEMGVLSTRSKMFTITVPKNGVFVKVAKI